MKSGESRNKTPASAGGRQHRIQALIRPWAEMTRIWRFSLKRSRITLARACNDRGDRTEAVAFATRALEIAKEQNKPEKIAEAQTCLAELRAGR